MLKQMCKSELNDSDIKAICKNRGFPAKEATSRDIFENFFLSNIGIKEALSALTYEEVVFLHLLNKINQEVDIEYFERLYDEFRQGRIKILVVSKVANFAVDLPDASVMIRVSGTFGSRQEEAQRLGRILRPKERTSHFYTLVSKGTVEQSFGTNRQLFLVEQGYRYQIRYF